MGCDVRVGRIIGGDGVMVGAVITIGGRSKGRTKVGGLAGGGLVGVVKHELAGTLGPARAFPARLRAFPVHIHVGRAFPLSPCSTFCGDVGRCSENVSARCTLGPIRPLTQP